MFFVVNNNFKNVPSHNKILNEKHFNNENIFKIMKVQNLYNNINDIKSIIMAEIIYIIRMTQSFFNI